MIVLAHEAVCPLIYQSVHSARPKRVRSDHHHATTHSRVCQPYVALTLLLSSSLTAVDNDQIVEIEGTVPFRISLDFSRMVLNDTPAALGQHSRRAETPSPDPSAYLTAPSTPNRRHEDEPVVTKTKAPQQHRPPRGSSELPPTPTSTVDTKRKPVDPARGQASRSRNTSAPTVHPSRDDYADEASECRALLLTAPSEYNPALRRLYGYHCDTVDPEKEQEWYVVTRGLATGVYDSW